MFFYFNYESNACLYFLHLLHGHAQSKESRPIINNLNNYHFTSCLLQVIAAGPYTTTDNLLFEPLQELLSYACRKQPQLLILVSPLNSVHGTAHWCLKCSATVHTNCSLADGTLHWLWSSWHKKRNCWPELSWYFPFWNSEKGR